MSEEKIIYMDNSATSPINPEVLDAMLPYLKEEYGNASTLYTLGIHAKRAINNARIQVAKLINAQDDEITFTSGGTESDNMAIKSTALAQLKTDNPKKHIITTQIEHPAVLNTCKYLEEFGFDITYLPVNEEGLISLDELENAIRDDTILISVMHSNNEIGTIQPVKQIGEIAHKHGIVFHCDAVQSVGKVPVDVEAQNIDILSLSGHKINGPKGIGAIYIKKGVKLDPYIHGGGQENSKRSGTENVAAIVGLGKAAQIAQENLDDAIKHNQEIRDAIIEKTTARIKDTYVNGSLDERLPNNVHLRFSGVEGESLILKLAQKGIYAATGSACSTHNLQGSHVLAALGITPALSHGSLRLSIGPENSIDDVDYIVDAIDETVGYLRSISPLWDNKTDEYIGDRFERPMDEEDEHCYLE